MVSQTVKFLLPVLGATQVLADSTASFLHGRSQDIDWVDCTTEYNSSYQLFCADFYVPLDYTNPDSTATINVPLQKFPALKSPSKGSVIYNCGGPGIDCRVLSYDGPTLQLLTGGEYDIVSFAPRGSTAENLFSCYSDQATRDRINAGSLGTAGNSSDAAIGQIWAYSQIQEKACLETQKDFGSLIGSTFVAKDMLRLTNALNEDGLFRYYGISAGSILGMTFLALYPNITDRVIMDGNQNINQYMHTYEREAITNSDDVWATFCNFCVEMPEQCPIGGNFSTGADLRSAVESAVWDLKYNPIPLVGLPNNEYYVLDYNTAKNYIFGYIQFPTIWSQLVPLVTYLVTKDLATANITDPAQLGFNAEITTNEAGAGITCSDKFTRSPSLEAFLPEIPARHKVSPFLSDVSDSAPMACAQWPFEAKERYGGNFNIKTRKPVLFIGNTFDPVTPLVSAKNISSGVAGSAVLQHNGTGHTSIYTQASRCTAKTAQAYFANWTLPQPGTICPVDFPPFQDATGWYELAAEFRGGMNGTK